jgi:hypothetical protein
MLAWIAKTVFSSVLGHLVLYVAAGGACFYFGYLYATRIDIGKIERMNHRIVELREQRNHIEAKFYQRQEELKTALNAYKRDDQLHRREIDALKRIQDRGCILSDEELQAHPYSRTLRDGFVGRVRQ